MNARNDIQLVDVASTGNTHYTVVIDALTHGKYILCEKPLANELKAAAEMVVDARKAGVVNMVNFNYR